VKVNSFPPARYIQIKPTKKKFILFKKRNSNKRKIEEKKTANSYRFFSSFMRERGDF